MTPSQAAQEEPTSPRTARCPKVAGRCEKDAGHNGGHYTEYKEPVWSWTVEAAAATPSLDGRLPSVEALAYALERVRDPDEPRRTVIPTGYSTMLSSEVPAVRRRQAELLLAFLKESGVAARLDEGSATPDQGKGEPR